VFERLKSTGCEMVIGSRFVGDIGCGLALPARWDPLLSPGAAPVLGKEVRDPHVRFRGRQPARAERVP
jgi:hypothetical protein